MRASQDKENKEKPWPAFSCIRGTENGDPFIIEEESCAYKCPLLYPECSFPLLLTLSETHMQQSAWGQARERGQTIPGGHSAPEAWLRDERRERMSRLSVYCLTTVSNVCVCVCLLQQCLQLLILKYATIIHRLHHNMISIQYFNRAGCYWAPTQRKESKLSWWHTCQNKTKKQKQLAVIKYEDIKQQQQIWFWCF